MLSIFATVITGVLVFVASQFIMKFVLEPLQEYRSLLGRIGSSLILYANVCQVSPPEDIATARKELRKQASDLMERVYSIPAYGLLRLLFAWMPSEEDVIAASRQLIGRSNDVGSEHVDPNREKEIIKRLRLSILAKRFGL